VQLDAARPWLGLYLTRGIAAGAVIGRQRTENLCAAQYQRAPGPIDDVVEATALNSSCALATRFDLEMKGFVRQLPGKQFNKILL